MTLITEQGKQVVSAARGWLGTRFHHQGRLKAKDGRPGGVDCLGLLVGVAGELGLLERAKRGCMVRPLVDFDRCDYGHLPDGDALHGILKEIMWPVRIEDMQVGDIVLMRFDKTPQHLAIITDYVGGGVGIIHALAAARKVVEHPLDEEWRKRIVYCYRVAQEGVWVA